MLFLYCFALVLAAYQRAWTSVQDLAKRYMCHWFVIKRKP